MLDKVSEFMNIAVDEIRQIEGFPGYFVTASGRIVSTKGKEPRFLTPWPTNDGHLKVRLSGAKRKNVYIHQEVLVAFVGPRPTPSHVARHLDGNCKNNRLTNLEWSTQAVNAADRKVHGTARPRKISDPHVQIIRDLKGRDGEINEAFPIELLSRIFGYPHRTIADVVKGRTHRKVEPLRIPKMGALVVPLPQWKPRGY